MKVLKNSVILPITVLMLLPGILLLFVPASDMIASMLAVGVLASILTYDYLCDAQPCQNDEDCAYADQKENVILPFYGLAR